MLRPCAIIRLTLHVAAANITLDAIANANGDEARAPRILAIAAQTLRIFANWSPALLTVDQFRLTCPVTAGGRITKSGFALGILATRVTGLPLADADKADARIFLAISTLTLRAVPTRRGFSTTFLTSFLSGLALINRPVTPARITLIVIATISPNNSVANTLISFAAGILTVAA